MNSKRYRSAHAVSVALSVGLLVSLVGRSATTDYQYDALGRLRKVVHDNGIVTDYTLDPSGNRTQVSDTPPTPPSVPSPFNVPSNSTTGVFNVSWGTSSGAVSRYELLQSSNASFSPQTVVYSGASTTIQLTRANGTYYFRARACNAVNCSGYTATSSTVVNIPPPAPGSPTALGKTLIANCSWRAYWTAPVGGVTPANYVVRDTAGNQQTVTATQAYVTCPFNNQNANKPKWVKACSSAGSCSTTVDFPP